MTSIVNHYDINTISIKTRTKTNRAPMTAAQNGSISDELTVTKPAR